jgi:hypothetical protein
MRKYRGILIVLVSLAVLGMLLRSNSPTQREVPPEVSALQGAQPAVVKAYSDRPADQQIALNAQRATIEGPARVGGVADSAAIGGDDKLPPRFGEWAAYDKRVEQNARSRVNNVAQAFERYMLASTDQEKARSALTTVRYAITVIEDYDRTSIYAEPGRGASLTPKEGFHVFTNGGARYEIPLGKYTLLDVATRASDAAKVLLPGGGSGIELDVVLPNASAVEELYMRALELLAAYK